MTAIPLFRKWTSFGSGAGVEIEGDTLHVAALRLRPSGHTVLGLESFAGLESRPAAEVGVEIAAFLQKHGLRDTALAVVLSASDSITRTLSLPGVASRDLTEAIGFQLDGAQPFGEGSAASAWSRLDNKGRVLLGSARIERIDRLAAWFAEAGLPVRTFTTAPAAVRSALQFLHDRPAEFLASSATEGEVRLYGESAAAPVFWAAMEMPQERAVHLARAQMRLPESAPQEDLAVLLPGASMAGAAALISACPWLAVDLNLLPEPLRATQSRWRFVPTAVLAGLLAVSGVALANLDRYENSKLIDGLERQTAQFSVEAGRAAQAARDRQAVEAKVGGLQEFRSRNRKDLDVLIESTRLIAAPAWASRLDLTRTSIAISGEAANAAELPRILDQSPLFRASEFLSPLSRSNQGPMDVFAIRAQREQPPPAGAAKL